MSHDFEKISASLRMHFCPECKASFGCILDDDGDCACEGKEFDWRKPWCPNCVEKEECTSCPRFNCRCEKCTNCTCSDCREERTMRENGEAPYDYSGPSCSIEESIREAFKKDLDQYLGRPLGVRVSG